MNHRKILTIAILTLIALALVACAPANPIPENEGTPGFLRGLLHGILVIWNALRIGWYYLTTGETPIGIYHTNGDIPYMAGFILGAFSTVTGAIRSRSSK